MLVDISLVDIDTLMSINIANLIKIDFWKWLCRNADKEVDVDPHNFWVNPLPADDPGFQSAIDSGVALLKSVVDVQIYNSQHLRGIRFRIEDRCYVCIEKIDGIEALSSKFPNVYDPVDFDFLLSVFVATKLSLGAFKSVPSRLLIESSKTPGLAADFEVYLPRLIIFELHLDHAKFPVAKLFSAVYCDAFRVGVGDWLSDESWSLLLSIPDAGHDWLLGEFVDVLAARQLRSMYLVAYRIVEFFFPLPGVNALKSKMGAKEDILEILDKCRTSLGWYWQHGRSAKGCAEMAGGREFLIPLINCELVAPSSSPEDGAEKLVNIRNELSHQDFRLVSYDDELLRSAIRSAFMFCAAAFIKYSEWNLNLGTPRSAQAKGAKRGEGN